MATRVRARSPFSAAGGRAVGRQPGGGGGKRAAGPDREAARMRKRGGPGGAERERGAGAAGPTSLRAPAAEIGLLALRGGGAWDRWGHCCSQWLSRRTTSRRIDLLRSA